MFKTIFDEINSNHDDKYSGEEVKAFLQSDKYLRDKLFRMVAGHPSEWHRTTQNNLKTLVNRLIAESTQEETKKLNQFEIDRFEKCEFASQISGLTQKLWHFHPVVAMSYLDTQGKVKVTVAMLKQVFDGIRGNSKDEFLQAVADDINKNSELYKLDTEIRLTHFFAQVRIEAGESCTVEENFNHTPESLN
jgi:hypothetical protein